MFRTDVIFVIPVKKMAEKARLGTSPSARSRKATPEKMVALKVSIEKKKECEAKALNVVALLLEATVVAEELLVKCLEINKSYYNDLVEERAITHLCGYPTCGNKLKKNASSQQYHVSLQFNKVFDVTKRKRFCSNLCFKASQFLENQLPTCPVWLLDEERQPDLKLYRQQEKILGLGNEVIFEEHNIKDELIKSKIEFDDSIDGLRKRMNKIKLDDSATSLEKAKSSGNFNNNCCLGQPIAVQCEPVKIKDVSPVEQRRVTLMPLSRLEVIEQSVKDWMTLETLQFLLGPQRYQNELASKGLSVDKVENSTGGKESREREVLTQKYMELCHKLDLEAIADHALDSKLVQEVQEENAKKVLPSYECLSQETKRFNLNVQAFYQGRMELLKEDANVEDNVTSTKKSSVMEKHEENSGPEAVSYPLTDNHDQRALRRRIVLDKLNRVNRAILQVLELSPRDISAELRQIVATFNLQAHNITFKPAEWTLVIIIIMHLLAVKMPGVQQKLQQESSQRCMAVLLQNFNKQVDYLTHLANLLMDVRNLLKI